YDFDDIFRGPAFRPGMIASWLAGFAVYEWLAQTPGLGFWSDFLARLHPPHAQIGASLPGFGIAFALGAVVSLAARRTGAVPLSRQAWAPEGRDDRAAREPRTRRDAGRAAAPGRCAVPLRPRPPPAARPRPDRRALRGRGPRRAVRPGRAARHDGSLRAR